MDTQAFRKFLVDYKLSEDEIQASIALAEKFEAFSRAAGCTELEGKIVKSFSKAMIEDGINTLPNYYALARYGRFLGNDEVYIAVVDLVDGHEAVGNLHRKVGEILGTSKRDMIFQRVALPPLGTPNEEKVKVTQKVMTRLDEVANPGECDQILSNSLRDLDDAWFQDEKKLFGECQDIDEFLDKNTENFIGMLEKFCEQGGLFFTQPITDEVLAYVRGERLIARGVREGNILYEVKIPHQTVEFLAETDPQKKRYYYCHCPWVKEALKDGEADIPSTFCTCSAGFHKKRWDVIYGQSLKAEIVESVLKGDAWCKIAIHLPETV